MLLLFGRRSSLLRTRQPSDPRPPDLTLERRPAHNAMPCAVMPSLSRRRFRNGHEATLPTQHPWLLWLGTTQEARAPGLERVTRSLCHRFSPSK